MNNERRTFTTEGKKFLDGKITKEEFEAFFSEFKSSLDSINKEFEKAVSPALYFNEDSKKISDQHEKFKSIYEDMDRGIRIVDSALLLNNMTKFQKGYSTITATADRLSQLKSDISVLSNSISM